MSAQEIVLERMENKEGTAEVGVKKEERKHRQIKGVRGDERVDGALVQVSGNGKQWAVEGKRETGAGKSRGSIKKPGSHSGGGSLDRSEEGYSRYNQRRRVIMSAKGKFLFCIY